MKVLWRSDLGQGKHDPLEVTHVVTKSGSQISADLVVPLQQDSEGLEVLTAAHDEKVGLLEVIEAQMAEIDRLAKGTINPDHDKVARERDDALGTIDELEDHLELLCDALGYGRKPKSSTGIAELDALLAVLR